MRPCISTIGLLLFSTPCLSSRWGFQDLLRPSRRVAGRASPNPQMPLPNIQLPGSSNDDGDGNGGDSKGDLIISDVIGKERSINMFAGFIRDTEQASSRLDDGQRNSTILAPLNSQIQKLPRKPWEDPEEYKALGAEAYAGNEGEDRAHRNLRRFVEAHIVPKSPWAKEERMKTMSGNEVWWEEKDGKKVIQPGDIEVTNIASRVSNGEVWIISGVLNYAQ